MPQLSEQGFPENIQIEDLIALAQEVGKGVAVRQKEIAELALTPQYRMTGEAIVRKTGDIEKDVWIQKKEDGSTLTSADIWGNNRLVAGLKRLTNGKAGIGIVTEENNPTANQAALINPVIITGDSLDNTSADNGFVQGGDDWSVTIGCIDAQTKAPTGGVIHYPKRGLTFYTGKDNQVYLRREGVKQDIPLQGTRPRTLEEVRRSGLDFLVSKSIPFVNGQEPVTTGINKSLPVNYAHASYFARCLMAISPEQRQQYGLGSAQADVVTQKGWSFWDLPPLALAKRLGWKAYNPDGTELDCMDAALKNGFKLPGIILLGNQRTLENIGFSVSKEERNIPAITELLEVPRPPNIPREKRVNYRDKSGNQR